MREQRSAASKAPPEPSPPHSHPSLPPTHYRECAYGFCDIRQFTDTVECLQDQVMRAALFCLLHSPWHSDATLLSLPLLRSPSSLPSTPPSLIWQVMLFTNSVGEIVHQSCHDNRGEPNKNIGDAFLIVWRPKTLGDHTKIVDGALTAFRRCACMPLPLPCLHPSSQHCTLPFHSLAHSL